MENFKQIAEDCLSGKLSGTFILRNGQAFHSKTHLSTTISCVYPYCIGWLCYSVAGNCYSKGLSVRDNDVVDFIPDNMQKQIKIDIPEGKVPIMKQTKKEVVITWKEKELTYDDIVNHIWEQGTQIGLLASIVVNKNTNKFSKKVNVLRKLTNIRNYFGKPGLHDTGWFIMSVYPEYNRFGAFKSIEHNKCPETVIFKEKEHAEQAIKMLGDELKYLFEPW